MSYEDSLKKIKSLHSRADEQDTLPPLSSSSTIPSVSVTPEEIRDTIDLSLDVRADEFSGMSVQHLKAVFGTL